MVVKLESTKETVQDVHVPQHFPPTAWVGASMQPNECTLYWSLSLCSSFCLFASAGAGRTGTFCALSTVLERVKAEGILDVFQTVKSLRLQRPHMVQTLVGTSYCIFTT